MFYDELLNCHVTQVLSLANEKKNKLAKIIIIWLSIVKKRYASISIIICKISSQSSTPNFKKIGLDMYQRPYAKLR